MVAQTLQLRDLEAAWRAFDRLDDDDHSHVKDFTVIEQKLNEFCLVKYDFDSGGIGVELIWSDLVLDEEEDELLRRLWPARQIQRERVWLTPTGFGQTRVRAWATT